jgi:hypothetical protein
MKKLLFAAVFAIAVLFPAGALAGTFNGVVVGKGGGNLAVAAKSGLVRTVHSRANFRVGARVHVQGHTVRSLGAAGRARVHGVVVRRAAGTTFLAAGHSLLAMRASTTPAAGAVVNANVAIHGGALTQQSMQVVGHDNRVTVQAPITAVGPGTITITITVNGQPLTLKLPAGMQLPASLVGQMVTVTVKVEDENEIEVEVENEAADNEANDANDDNDDNGADEDGGGGQSGHGGHGCGGNG